jgi:hypothetical protein
MSVCCLGKQRGKDICRPLPELEVLMGIQSRRLYESLGLLVTRFPDGFEGKLPFERIRYEHQTPMLPNGLRVPHAVLIQAQMDFTILIKVLTYAKYAQYSTENNPLCVHSTKCS